MNPGLEAGPIVTILILIAVDAAPHRVFSQTEAFCLIELDPVGHLLVWGVPAQELRREVDGWNDATLRGLSSHQSALDR